MSRAATSLVALALMITTAAAAEPAVKLHVPAKGPATIDVTGLDAAALGKLAKQESTAERWAEVLSVHIHDPKAESSQQIVLSGTYKVDGGVLRFEPKFPLVPGLSYRATFQQADRKVVADLTLPRPELPPAAVERVYPSGDVLPENNLRFYIHFTTPMGQGRSYESVKLLNAAGKPVVSPFLELGEELWDPAGKRFTLFIDPGRIKKGLKPREDLGPVLEADKTYTLVIATTWLDAQGQPLTKEFRKNFRTTAAVEEGIEPKDWKLTPPTAGTSEPLTVTFHRPLDHAMLHRVLWVTDAQGQTIEGKVTVGKEEKSWQFTPRRAWAAGDYKLEVDKTLEDQAGNRVGRPFEVDVLRPIEKEIKTQTVSLPFRVATK